MNPGWTDYAIVTHVAPQLACCMYIQYIVVQLYTRAAVCTSRRCATRAEQLHIYREREPFVHEQTLQSYIVIVRLLAG